MVKIIVLPVQTIVGVPSAFTVDTIARLTGGNGGPKVVSTVVTILEKRPLSLKIITPTLYAVRGFKPEIFIELVRGGNLPASEYVGSPAFYTLQ